jgi:hypothetical protein
MQYVDAIEKGEPPANPTKIIKASIASGDQAASTASLAPPPQPVTPPLSAKEQAKADKEARRAMERALHDAEQAPPGQQ